MVSLQEEQYHKFTQNLLTDYDFIHDNIDNMYVDRQDATHCLLVLGDGESTEYSWTVQWQDYADMFRFCRTRRDFITKKFKQ